MGVYIKGMEMPQSCILCELACLYRIHSSTSRSIYCPLVEVKDESQIKRGCANCEENGWCRDAFSEVSKYCEAYK